VLKHIGKGGMVKYIWARNTRLLYSRGRITGDIWIMRIGE
jgi:hypothetical protein